MTPAPAEQRPNHGERTGDVVRVGAADVIAAPSARALPLQSFEELGIPASFRAAVEGELTQGEKLLWVGRPSRNREVHPRNTLLPVAGFCLIVFGLGAAVIGLATHLGFFPVVFGGALAIIGSACCLPLVVDPTKSCRSCYVVTNQRALVVEWNMWRWAPAATSYVAHQLLGMERRSHPDVKGAGDLVFEYVLTMSANNYAAQTGTFLQQNSFGTTGAPKRVPRGFLLLDQVREVENLIRTNLLQQLENAPGEPRPTPVESATPAPDGDVVPVACACGLTIEAPDSLAGKAVKCPQCSAAVSVPAPAVAAAPYREDGQVPADIKAKLLGDLDPTERVVWVAQPVGTLVFLRNVYFLFPTVILAGIALVWLTGSLFPAKTAADAAAQKAAQHGGKSAAMPAKSSPGGLMAPLGLLCVAAGFAAVPFARWYFATRTGYALTSRRALVYKAGLFGPELESYPPLEVANMRRSDSWLSSGSGDLIFRTATVITTSRNRNGTSSSSVRRIHYGFLGIAKVGEVERLVRETLINRFEERLTRAGNW